MDSNLGNKIKSMRKELKMTQSQLAQPEMTKSMLSQIENGLATPSMKNLQLIAKKLNKPMSYFLEDTSTDMDKARKDNSDEIIVKLQSIDDLIKDDKCKEALSYIEDLQSKISLSSDNKLLGDILYRKGKCLFDADEFDDAERLLKKAYEIYLENNSYTEAAKSYIEIASKPWRNFNYEECISIYIKAKEIYDKSLNRNTHFEIELLNDLAAFYSAIGDFDKALANLKDALDISNTTGVYYKADEIHRLTAALCFIKDDVENYQINIEKAEQFAKFSDNKSVIYYIFAVKVVYENSRGNYKKALEYLGNMRNAKTNLEHFYYREKAKALYYIGEYEEALDNIKLVDYPSYTNHRFDYLMLWSSKVYEGLIYSKMNDLGKALESIFIGIDNMRILGDSKPLSFALESASEIYYKLGELEKAYQYLKEAKDMKDIMVKNKIYF